jgi:phosphoribosylanthranilate isomerase
MTQIKICGLTNLTDARVAWQAGANLLGFIFYPKSPRYVTPEAVKQILNTLRTEQVDHVRPLPRCVGVFVNEETSRIVETLDFAGLDCAQLHGNEPPEVLLALRGRAYKAIRPASADEAWREAERYAPFGLQERGVQAGESSGPAILIDAYHPNLYGGTGHVADWSLAAQLARRYPGLLLAGSLTAENVAQAIQTVQPWGVDVSSGVEAEPGRKEHKKVEAFTHSVLHAQRV